MSVFIQAIEILAGWELTVRWPWAARPLCVCRK